MSPVDQNLDFESQLKEAQSQLADDPQLALSKAEDLLNARTDARVLRLIAEAYRRLGKGGEAESTDLLAIRASGRDPQLRQASHAIEQGHWHDAETLARAILKSSEDDLLALTILAEALVGMRRAIEAERAIRPVLDKVPNFSRARMALSSSLIVQCRVHEAIETLEATLREQPNNVKALELLAEPLVSVRQFDRAIEAHERLLSFENDNPRAWVDFAATLRFAGRQSDAQKALQQAIAIDPSDGPAWWAMANMAPEAIGGPETELMERALERSRDDDKASYLHIALATIFDRSGNYERAFHHFASGKEIRRQASGYDPGRLAADIDVAIRLFDEKFFAVRADFGAADGSPIFIVGLPRSGSTLVERILAGHSKIEDAGELPIIFRLVAELDAEAGRTGGYRPLVAEMSSERASELGELYLHRAREFRTTDKPFFTDKLNLNWLHLPLIRLILPHARIIDVRRNAVDCCWSNFKLIFAPGHPASDDLGGIGRLYRDYVRMMDHAERWVDGRMLTVRYESVVENVEAETRRMLAFLGLDFEPACLDFHRLEGPVATISAEQVRRPLNREGIGRWKPYQQWLGPLFDVLGPFAEQA